MAYNQIAVIRSPRRIFLPIGSYVILLFCASLCFRSAMYAQEERGPALPDGEGKQLVAMVCSQCHGLKETAILRDGQKGWEEVVDRMVLYGAQLSPSEADLVTRYLATQLGPGLMHSAATPSGVAAGDGPMKISLPEGPGRQLVAERCALCHDLAKVISVHRTKADWESITIDMMQRGVNATPVETGTMIAYLQANFSTNTQTGTQSQQRAVSTGKDIFTQRCFVCHSVQPGQVLIGPSVYGEMREPHPKMTEAQIRTIVRDGKGKMPAFKDLLTKDETDQLLAYLRNL